MKTAKADRDYRAVYAELSEAQADRQAGYQGRTAREILADMERVISVMEAKLK